MNKSKSIISIIILLLGITSIFAVTIDGSINGHVSAVETQVDNGIIYVTLDNGLCAYRVYGTTEPSISISKTIVATLLAAKASGSIVFISRASGNGTSAFSKKVPATWDREIQRVEVEAY
jgi:hypothetical protein